MPPAARNLPNQAFFGSRSLGAPNVVSKHKTEQQQGQQGQDMSPYITVRTGAGGADYARRVLSTSVTTWRYPTALRGLPRPLGRP
jgi:hypothetical protein